MNLTGRGARTAAGAALVADGLVGIDLPGGRKRAGLFGSLVAIVVGMAFIWAGLLWHGQHRPYADGLSATATVTGVETSRDTKGQTMYARVLTFTAADGRPTKFVEPERTSSRPTTGSTATVSYLLEDPASARVIPSTDWLPYSVIAAGVLTALIGIVIFFLRLVTLATGIYLLASARRAHN